VFVTDNGIPLPVVDASIDCLQYVSFDVDTVLRHLKKLEPKLFIGVDGIPPYALKELAHSLCKPLSLLFSLSFRLSRLPRTWKIAKILPIHKKGSENTGYQLSPHQLTGLH
jgi:hypothetical protein